MKKKVFKMKKEKKEVVILKTDRNKVLRFPHISRFFTARLFYNLFIVFLGFGVLGILGFNYLYPANDLEKARVGLFLRPYEANSYMNLGNLYLGVNDLESAKREYNTAIFFAKTNEEKIEAMDRIFMIERSKKTRIEIEQEISKWEVIASQKPNYRDAFFKLAVLNYQIFKNEVASKYLDRVMALDPNFEEGKRLRELL